MQNHKIFKSLQDLTQKVNLAADQAGQKVEDFIQNEAALRPLLMAAHSRLPFFIRILLKEDKFIEFIVQNKEKLLIHRQIDQVVAKIIKKFSE